MSPTPLSAWAAHVDLATQVRPVVQTPLHSVLLEAIPDTIAHLRLSRGVPESVRAAAKSGQFCTVVQEPGAATAWVSKRALQQAARGGDDGVEDLDQGKGWCAFRLAKAAGLKGPVPFGAGHLLYSQLAEANIAVRVLSAFGSELLFVPEASIQAAAVALLAHNHAIWPIDRVARPMKDHPTSDPALLQQYAGAWTLVQHEEPLGTISVEFTDGTGPMRLQAPGGLFIELRMAQSEQGLKAEASFGGKSFLAMDNDGRAVCSSDRAVDYQPPVAQSPKTQIKFMENALEAVSLPNQESRDLWARLPNANESHYIALELESEDPEPRERRNGLWIFVGQRFARILGPERGRGLVGSTCCRSISSLQKLRGHPEIRGELEDHYDAVHGVVERPGLLKTSRVSCHPDRENRIFYDASSSCFGEVVKDKRHVVYKQPTGRKEIWRIVEWNFDPFSPRADDAGLKRHKGLRVVPSVSRSVSESSAASSDEDEEEAPARPGRTLKEAEPERSPVVQEKSSAKQKRKKETTRERSPSNNKAKRKNNKRHRHKDSAADHHQDDDAKAKKVVDDDDASRGGGVKKKKKKKRKSKKEKKSSRRRDASADEEDDDNGEDGKEGEAEDSGAEVAEPAAEDSEVEAAAEAEPSEEAKEVRSDDAEEDEGVAINSPAAASAGAASPAALRLRSSSAGSEAAAAAAGSAQEEDEDEASPSPKRSPTRSPEKAPAPAPKKKAVLASAEERRRAKREAKNSKTEKDGKEHRGGDKEKDKKRGRKQHKDDGEKTTKDSKKEKENRRGGAGDAKATEGDRHRRGNRRSRSASGGEPATTAGKSRRGGREKTTSGRDVAAAHSSKRTKTRN